MKIFLLIILSVLVLAVGLITMAAWYKWQIYVHLKDSKLSLELRGFGIRRIILNRDFSKSEDRDKKNTKKKKSDEDNKGKKGFSEKFKADKERVYTEDGGYNHQGLLDVIYEYKQAYDEIKETIYKVLGDMRYRIEIPFTRVKLDFGTGDPAYTGMLYGGIWGIIGTIYPIIRKYVYMKYPLLDVTPDFEGKRFEIEIESIIKVKPAHIINALLKHGCRLVITYCSKKIKNKKKEV